MNRGYIKIENTGEIELNSLLLIGASTKRDDMTKIGYFGSGLKYAIAVLLKNKIDFKIFSGMKEIKITTALEEFRDKAFNVIKINGKKTNFTTEMGPDWEPWFAVREIYCNALDEFNYGLGIADKFEPEAGKTKFYISFSEKLNELFSNWSKYFSDKRTDLIMEDKKFGMKLFSGNSKDLIIYRKGVRCYETKRKNLFHYDLDWIKINESRVLTSEWDLQYYLPQKIAITATRDVIKNILDNYQNTFEEGLYWNYVTRYSEDWLMVIAGRKLVVDSIAGYFSEEISANRDGYLILPRTLIDSLKDYFGNKVEVEGSSDKVNKGTKIEATEKQRWYINFAKDFLKKGGIDISDPIEVYNFKDEKILGKAENGEIQLSPKLFGMGKKKIVMTVLEELSHLQSGADDKTRSFQDYLFNQLVGLLEEKVGEQL